MNEANSLREALHYVLKNRLAIGQTGELLERDTAPISGYGGWYDHEIPVDLRSTLQKAIKRVQDGLQYCGQCESHHTPEFGREFHDRVVSPKE
jgi:hypothetical protein